MHILSTITETTVETIIDMRIDALNKKRDMVAAVERRRQYEIFFRLTKHREALWSGKLVSTKRFRLVPSLMPRRDHIPVVLVRSMLLSQGGRCAFCARVLSRSGFHVDHIRAISRGGTSCADNLQLLCPKCNVRKAAKAPSKAMLDAGLLPLV